jgi:hypothetical protein
LADEIDLKFSVFALNSQPPSKSRGGHRLNAELRQRDRYAVRLPRRRQAIRACTAEGRMALDFSGAGAVVWIT